MRRGLGMGLSRLIGESEKKAPEREPKKAKPPKAVNITAEAESESTPKRPDALPIEAIVANRRQPRQHFDDVALRELAESIRTFGILQPLIVRPIADNRFELIAGERRLRAAKLLGLKEVPVVVRASDSQTSLELALIENIQREDISAIECARAYQQLSTEFGLTQDQIAQRVGKSRTAIANTVRLLRLPDEIIESIAEGQITEGQARPLLSLERPADQIDVFEMILVDGLSARQVEDLVKRMLEPVESTREPKKQSVNATIKSLERSLSEHFGFRTIIKSGKKGGKLSIEFKSEDDLTRLLDILGFQLDS